MVCAVGGHTVEDGTRRRETIRIQLEMDFHYSNRRPWNRGGNGVAPNRGFSQMGQVEHRDTWAAFYRGI